MDNRDKNQQDKINEFHQECVSFVFRASRTLLSKEDQDKAKSIISKGIKNKVIQQ